MNLIWNMDKNSDVMSLDHKVSIKWPVEALSAEARDQVISLTRHNVQSLE